MNALNAYGKLGFGDGYIKRLQKRLNLINMRLDTVISNEERKELEEQKGKIENILKTYHQRPGRR